MKRSLFPIDLVRSAAAMTALCLCLNVPCTTAAVGHGAQERAINHKNKSDRPIKGTGSGTLLAMLPSGKTVGACPLKHTTVNADVAGYVARVSVRQEFINPYNDKIEAVYTFPLPDSAAVDEMIMKVGNRTILGTIKKREEAKQIYDDAKARGKVASLLDQERTNIFTQSVANIEPGAKVEITLKYVDLLPYEAGSFAFSFPTVVGPRFIPGNATGQSGTGRAKDTDAVPDASKITPQVADGRSGHDISINVHLDAAVPITDVTSKLHEVTQKKMNDHETNITLKDSATIPNKDFVLNWTVASNQLRSGYLTHKDGASGYFSLMVLPPKRVETKEIAPKEMIFLVDCSGSQSGQPLEKCKETMSYILDHMNPQDTFQVIAFSDHLQQFPAKPEGVSGDMVNRAKAFINKLTANGGTWMAPAVEKACALPADDHRLRIVTFMTDGYVGNDYEVLSMVHKLRGKSRWFPFGTGNSVNRMLIDGIAQEGGGEPDYVLLNSSGAAVGKKFYDRISTPVLTDIALDFHGLPVKEVLPNAISDVWAEKPLYIVGKYTKGAAGTVTISGFAGGKPYKQDLKVELPELGKANQVLGSVWARKKVDRLMAEDYLGAQNGAVNKELKDEIVKEALEHHIMTQYTSFVAVEEIADTKGGAPRTVPVPVDMPDGVSRETTLEKGSFKAMAAGSSRAYGGVAQRASMGFYGAPPPPLPQSPMVNRPVDAISANRRLMVETSHKEKKQNGENSAQKKDAEEADPQDKKAPSQDAKIKTESYNLKGELSKLSSVLQELVASPNGSVKGVSVNDGDVRIKITLKNTSKFTLDRLKALGARIVITERNSVIALVPVSVLKRISTISEVTHMDLAIPVSYLLAPIIPSAC